MLLFRFVLLTSFGLICGPAVWASNICTTVSLPDGQPLYRAEVKVLSLLDTNVRFSAWTDRDGKVCLNLLPESLYSVEASKPGFLNSRYYPVRILFPNDVDLDFRLPVGEIREGLLEEEVTLSGTLRKDGKPVDGVRICAAEKVRRLPATCATTNDLGQYVLTLAPAIYAIELTHLRHRIQTTTLDLTAPGQYRDRLTIADSSKNAHEK